ncbi:hypothetical protein [Actinophytocola sp. NPDC049390]|uniref:hypothetical protein n=1 Tax=Actinophytocola sp. NPDC049390 TaxID=3363894 RepID=UPI0037883B86
MRSFEESLRRVEALEREVVDRFRNAEAMREATERITATSSSASGAFTVTVDHTGGVIDVVGTDAVRKLATNRIGAAVLEAIRSAQAQLPGLLRAELGSIGGDPAMAVVVERYEQRFAAERVAERPERHLPIGEIED